MGRPAVTATVNGWPVLAPDSSRLHRWVIPGTRRQLTMRHGSAGFVLAHLALRFNDRVERLALPGEATPDDGAYAYRRITGGTSWSQHATGTAMDLNWRRHPYGVPAAETFTRAQRQLIRHWLRRVYVAGGDPVVEWGGDWPSHPASTARPDAMHFELAQPLEATERLARRLMDTERGRLVLAANPTQRKVILR